MARGGDFTAVLCANDRLAIGALMALVPIATLQACALAFVLYMVTRSKARQAIDIPELMSEICYAHNVGKSADSREARKILLLQNIYLFGWTRVSGAIEHLPLKLRSPDMSLVPMLE